MLREMSDQGTTNQAAGPAHQYLDVFVIALGGGVTFVTHIAAFQFSLGETMRLSRNHLLTALISVGLSACVSSASVARQEPDCVLRQVVDGDTFNCHDGRKVRLTGIDSPEREQRPYGEQSRQALLRLAPPGTRLRLEGDVAPRDRYGRVLAYVWAGSTLINEALVQSGWAVLYTVPPNVKYAKRLERAQQEARAHRAGLWLDRGFDCLPSDFRRGKCLSPP
jgi:micrococcal nuclease